MPTYEVKLKLTSYEYHKVTVTAADPEEAKTIAHSKTGVNTLFQSDGINVDVISVVELK